MEIKYTGTSQNVLKILHALEGNTKAVRVFGNSIIIPTNKGAKAFYKGETIIIENGEARLKDG